MFTTTSLRARSVTLSMFAVLAAGSTASAEMSYDDYLQFKRIIRRDSDVRLLLVSDVNIRNDIRREEDEQVQALWDDYLAKHGKLALAGNAMINGVTSATSDIAESGASAVLSFGWINGIAKQPTAGPVISSVRYEVNPDPNQPNLWILVGVGTNPATQFAFPFITQGFEPDYRATPLDATGQPIFIAGVGGSNVAFGSVTVIPTEPAPTPGTALLAGLGTIVMGAYRRRSPTT